MTHFGYLWRAQAVWSEHHLWTLSACDGRHDTSGPEVVLATLPVTTNIAGLLIYEFIYLFTYFFCEHQDVKIHSSYNHHSSSNEKTLSYYSLLTCIGCCTQFSFLLPTSSPAEWRLLGCGGLGGETMIGRERGNQGLQDCQYVYTCMNVDAGESDG